ncbi:Tetratricopeptide repeat protein 4 [Taenia solium]|eukprot:TsM_001024500 transcript=TsM_001024500 gene=TsM_001024500
MATETSTNGASKSTFTKEEEKEIFSHPFFAHSAEEMEGNPAYEALRTLKYESDDPNANAESFKEEGNYYIKQKDYEKAITAYTGGILAKPTDKKLLAVLYTNRGIAHGLRKNHGSCVKDCNWAVKQDPTHLKAYFQAVKSLMILSKPAEAVAMCEAGLKVAAGNETLTELKAKAMNLQAAMTEKEEKKQSAVEESHSKLSGAFKQLAARGIVIDFEQPPVGLPEHAAVEISFDHMNLIHWPVLFMYPEFSQTDFVQDVAEYLTIRECLKHVLNPSEPPPWDKEKAYTTSEDKLEVYFEDTKFAKQMVEVPITRTITELTRCPGYSESRYKTDSLLAIIMEPVWWQTAGVDELLLLVLRLLMIRDALRHPFQ